MMLNENPRGRAGDAGVSDSVAAGKLDSPEHRASRNLRQYQRDVLDQLHAAFAEGKRAPLIVAATGSGKTVMAAAAIDHAVDRGHRVLFLAHRRELIHQAHRKLYDQGIDAGVILAGHPARQGAPVQVASVQTLHARAVRGSAMDLPPADMVVIDEAHHATARTYQAIVAAYPDAVVVGLTATPCRGDGRGLGGIFDCIIEAPSVADLIAGGFLVPTRVYAPDQPDLIGVRTERGDYVESQLAERMDKPKLIGSIIEHWHRLADQRRTVVFATGVLHSVHLRDEFRRSGVAAEHLDGSTPIAEREAVLAGLARGSVDVVCNAMILTEGWDRPDAAALILARPTKSLGLYRQMVGRVLRPAPGKVDALILDHAGAVYEHGLPEEPIEWTLAPDKRAETSAQKSRAAGAAPTLTTCPECSAVRMGGSACTACGWRPTPRGQSFEVIDGTLGRVDATGATQGDGFTAADRLRWHSMLAGIASSKGYNSGWAAHKYKEKFGQWPPNRTVVTEPPSPEVLAWVRSRQIAYAKAMEKKGAAR
ncbi:DNA repair protein RadD [Constrictibacter sp. MBR-5]|jgi:superfamily II DNA or RNA helicase